MDIVLTMINKDIQYCKRFLKKYGKSYYFASQFFPTELRQATYALYAFVRVPDEYVDNENNSTSKLLLFKKNWRSAYKNKSSSDPVLNATSFIFHKYKIPFRYSLDFLKAMEIDTYKKTYKDFAELKKYMYGSAAVVGLMMTYIIGFKHKLALKYAEDLGYAMQLTNFLRDIGEDYALRQRIYLPQSELKKYKLTEKYFSNKIIDANFIKLLKFNIARTRNYYKSAEKGLKYLNPGGHKAVKTALVLYSQILKKIEKNNYDVFNKRAHTSFLEKIFLTLGAIYG